MEIPMMNIFVEAKQGLYEDNMIDVNIKSVCPSSDQQSWERSQSQFKGRWVRNQSEIATGTRRMVVANWYSALSTWHLVPGTWYLVPGTRYLAPGILYTTLLRLLWSNLKHLGIKCTSLCYYTSNLREQKLIPSHSREHELWWIDDCRLEDRRLERWLLANWEDLIRRRWMQI